MTRVLKSILLAACALCCVAPAASAGIGAPDLTIRSFSGRVIISPLYKPGVPERLAATDPVTNSTRVIFSGRRGEWVEDSDAAAGRVAAIMRRQRRVRVGRRTVVIQFARVIQLNDDGTQVRQLASYKWIWQPRRTCGTAVSDLNLAPDGTVLTALRNFGPTASGGSRCPKQRVTSKSNWLWYPPLSSLPIAYPLRDHRYVAELEFSRISSITPDLTSYAYLKSRRIRIRTIRTGALQVLPQPAGTRFLGVLFGPSNRLFALAEIGGSAEEKIVYFPDTRDPGRVVQLPHGDADFEVLFCGDRPVMYDHPTRSYFALNADGVAEPAAFTQVGSEETNLVGCSSTMLVLEAYSEKQGDYYKVVPLP